MKPSRLRIKVRKMLEQVDEATEEGGELNIIPYLDIVTNIIMFMLATTTFAAALGDINVSSPAASSNAAMVSPPDDTPKNELNLTVSVTDKGFTIAASGAVLHQGFSFDGAGNLVETSQTLPTIPKKGPDFDFDLLKKKMLEIKKAPVSAGETKVIINSNAEILYDTIVQVMDACRGKLIVRQEGGKDVESYEGFSDVLLSAGVN